MEDFEGNPCGIHSIWRHFLKFHLRSIKMLYSKAQVQIQKSALIKIQPMLGQSNKGSTMSIAIPLKKNTHLFKKIVICIIFFITSGCRR